VRFRILNVQGEAAARLAFYESAERFQRFFRFTRSPPPTFQEAETCRACDRKIGTMFSHRHHCRRCGQTFCDKHTKQRHLIPALGYTDKAVRCCDNCSAALTNSEPLAAIAESVQIEPEQVRAQWAGMAVCMGLPEAGAQSHVDGLLEHARRLEEAHASTVQFDVAIRELGDMLLREHNQTMQPEPVAPAEAALGEDEEEAHQCVVCFDNDISIVFGPCGHACCCEECSTRLSDCPVCRTRIDTKMRFFLPS